jgi:hypothetical protein
MTSTQLEQEVLKLPPSQRAHLAVVAWDSLESDPSAAADSTVDPEGLALAAERDLEIESGTTEAITHSEFRNLTGGS